MKRRAKIAAISKQAQAPATVDPVTKKLLSWKDLLAPIAVFIWPFIYMARHVIPINGQYVATGNDFVTFYYNYKIYLLAHLAKGHLPLWSPSEAAGFPFFSSPLTQSFYPLNLLLVIWYKLKGGYDPIDYQIFTVLGLSIFGLGLYYWLKEISASKIAVLFSVLVMTISFRMTETFRFPNAVHTAAWYPWVLYALTKLNSAESIRKSVTPCIILFFSTICLCTGGYPYFLYYSIFLFVPYWIMLLTPLSKRLTCKETLHPKKTFFLSIIVGAAAVAICSPYLIAIKRLMSETYNRAGKSFDYSTMNNFDFWDTVGSLIYPPMAQWEGWYFFSIAGLLLILLLTACLALGYCKPTEGKILNGRSNYRFWFIAILVWIAVCSSISYGKDSEIFRLLWHVMPGFSSLRFWGRFSIVLVPLFAWLLCMAYDVFEGIVLGKRAGGQAVIQPKRPLLFVLAAGYAVILMAQIVFYSGNMVDKYWQDWGQTFDKHRITFIILGFAAFFLIFTLVAASRHLNRLRRPRAAVFITIFIIASAEMWPVGTRVWTTRPWSGMGSVSDKPKSIDVDVYHRQAFLSPRTNAPGTAASSPIFNAGLASPNWYFSSYVNFYRDNENDKNRDTLLGVNSSQKVFFCESLNHSSIASFLKDSLRFGSTGQLVSYNGDVLVWKINSPQDGYLSFIDNIDPYWNVYVDGRRTKMESLFGTFKSVHIGKGGHQVEFRYEPTLRAILFGTKSN